MQRVILNIGLAALLFTACGSHNDGPTVPPEGEKDKPGDNTEEVQKITVGEEIPAWQEGMMDIHFINTTTGESMFVIFPDGTQMLIDAASSTVATNSDGNTTNAGIRSRWDPTKTNTRGSEIISEYIRKCMTWTKSDKLDYTVLTHFHNDHFGGYSASLPKSKNSSTYAVNGMAEIFDNFKIGKLLDRGYPEYNYPFDMAKLSSNYTSCANYINAVKWHVSQNNFIAEKFRAGVDDQIVLTHKPDAYPTAKVRNIAVNGEIWTGNGTSTQKTFPELSQISYKDSKNIASSDNCPPENITSCVMKISYGKFDFFAGGDLQYNGRSTFSWKDAELPCARAAGRVELMKADHHGVTNTNSSDALKALSPQAIVVCSWVDCHPRTNVMNTMETTLSAMDLYITNFWQGARPSGVDNQVTAAAAARVKGYDGHVVVRVVDGGNSYRIMTLTDSDGKMTVKNVSKSYICR